MKNILFIIVDSMSYERIKNTKYVGSLTPFLDSIENECVVANNLFSQGPYTEAGTKGLLCCCDTLDKGGYFLRYDSQEKFITDYFKDIGYETFNINSPAYLLSERTLKNIDHMYYTSGLDFRFLWSQRFSFYYDKWKSGEFTVDDYDYLSKFVELVFQSEDDFLSSNNSLEKYHLINELIDNDTIEFNLNLLEEEKKKFSSNKKEYIDSVFDLKLDHPIFGVKNINLSKMIKTENVKKALKNHKKTINKIKHIQFHNNLFYNHCNRGTFKKTIKSIFGKSDNIYEKKYGDLINKFRNVVSGREIKVYKSGLYYTNDPYKLIPSAKTQFEFATSIINNSSKTNNFVFVHVEEPHYFNTFFSFDKNDEDLLNEEFDYISDYLKNIDKKYHGSLYYDLSIRYIDRQIEGLYTSLKKSGKLDDTIVVITADHGSSYFFDPIRSTLVNNFHSENYHVPFYAFGGEIKKLSINKLVLGKDVIPTIFDLCGYKGEKKLKGKSIVDDTYLNDSILIEYMGPGCPDIRLKPVWLAARSFDYLVCYIGKLVDPFSEENIIEIYDLKIDPKEQRNIKQVRNEQINNLIFKVKTRFMELKKENGFNYEK